MEIRPECCEMGGRSVWKEVILKVREKSLYFSRAEARFPVFSSTMHEREFVMETHPKRLRSSDHAVKAPPKTTTITQKEFIPARPDEIYDALLNEEKHSAFTGAKATCDRRVGGKFTAWDGYISGINLKLENGRRIVQEWRTTEWPKGYKPSLIEFTLKPKGNGTEVHMRQSNIPASQAAGYAEGWVEHYWTPLKKYFEKTRHG